METTDVSRSERSPVVRLRAVTKRYEAAGVPAVDAVDLMVDAGEAVAIMGPSGSGKSTLLHLVAGLDRPTAGDVEVAGTALNRLSETALSRFRRQHVGIVFQFFHLLDDLSARDNVLLPALLGGTRAPRARARADELLDTLGLAARAHAFPQQLSGGERQRVAVARALVNRPTLLLADEPTGAVDATAGAQIVDLLQQVHTAGQTVVVVTHDAEVARRCATRTVEVHDGRLSEALPV